MQLDPDPAEWRALATAVVDYLAEVLRDLPDAPASAFDGVDDVVADPAIRRPPPETGRPLAELLQVLDRAAGVGLHPLHGITQRSISASDRRLGRHRRSSRDGPPPGGATATAAD